MLKVDYILLSRHFSGQTSEVEEHNINHWKGEHIVHQLTYQRLYKVWLKEQGDTEKVLPKEVLKAWKKIMMKVMEELPTEKSEPVIKIE